MRSRRLTIASTVLLVLALAAVPSSANAGSLLSGYGGPGDGSQAILGSALLGGPSGGGGSGGRGTTTGAGGERLTVGSAGAGSGGGAPAATGTSHESSSAGEGGKQLPRSPAAAATGFRGSGLAQRASVSASRGGSQTLGLSDADALYILLALGALVLTGALTRILARQSGQAQGLR